MKAVLAIGMVILRYGLLIAARSAGWLRGRIFGSRLGLAIGIIAAAIVLRLVVDRRDFGKEAFLADPWFSPERVFFIVILVALGRWVLHARRRLVIGNFGLS